MTHKVMLRLQPDVHTDFKMKAVRRRTSMTDLFREGIYKLINGEVQIKVVPRHLSEPRHPTSVYIMREKEDEMKQLARKLGVSMDDPARIAVHVMLNNVRTVTVQQAPPTKTQINNSTNQVITNDQSGGVGQLNLNGGQKRENHHEKRQNLASKSPFLGLKTPFLGPKTGKKRIPNTPWQFDKV